MDIKELNDTLVAHEILRIGEGLTKKLNATVLKEGAPARSAAIEDVIPAAVQVYQQVRVLISQELAKHPDQMS